MALPSTPNAACYHLSSLLLDSGRTVSSGDPGGAVLGRRAEAAPPWGLCAPGRGDSGRRAPRAWGPWAARSGGCGARQVPGRAPGRTHRCGGRIPSGGTWWRGASGWAGVGASPAAAARGRHGVSAVTPSQAYIGSRQLGVWGRPGEGAPGGPEGAEVRAEVLSPRAGRAGRGQRPLGCARRARSASPAAAPGAPGGTGSALAAPGGTGLHRGAGRTLPRGARSPAAAPAERARGALAFHPPPIVIASPAASPFAPHRARGLSPEGHPPPVPAGAGELGQEL